MTDKSIIDHQKAFGGTNPSPFKGAEYDKKSIMNAEEEDEFYELRDQEMILEAIQYQKLYFERSSKYNSEEWTKHWLLQDGGNNKV